MPYIPENRKLQHEHTIAWTPGREGLGGNKSAHALARAAINREEQDDLVIISFYLSTYREHIKALKLCRKGHSSSHKNVTSVESYDWRRIQASTYLDLSKLSRVYPARYDPERSWCKEEATLIHIPWQCFLNPTSKECVNSTVE